MVEISIGAVGAAVVAGLVSVLGLIISKETKISDFRQVWIEDLRKCIVAYVVNINALSDLVRLKQSNNKVENADFLTVLKSLNESNHGIKLRINSNEKPARDLLSVMAEIEELSKDNGSLVPHKLISLEEKFTDTAKNLLKFEWSRVKNGEVTFRVAKYISIVLTFVIAIFFIYSFFSNYNFISGDKKEKCPIVMVDFVR